MFGLVNSSKNGYSSLFPIVGMGVVAGLALLFGAGVCQAAQMGNASSGASSTTGVITRGQIPESSQGVRNRFLTPYLPPLPTSLSFLKSSFADRVCSYFEGEPVCVSIDRSNARELLDILDYREDEDNATNEEKIREKCNRVLNGELEQFRLDSQQCDTPKKLAPHSKKGGKRVAANTQSDDHYDSRIQRPGVVLVGKGDQGYKISDLRIRENHWLVDKQLKVVAHEAKTDPNLKMQIEQYKKSEKDPDDLGVLLGYEENKFLLAVNPNFLPNHRKAKKYFQSKLDRFKSMSDGEIIQTIKKLMQSC